MIVNVYNKQDLEEKLPLHAKWQRGEDGGERLVCSYGADLRGADLSETNLIEADLIEADLSETNFSGADLSGADLRGANFSGAGFSGANFSKADLRGANFSKADLRGANFSEADLSETNLIEADLRGADLSFCEDIYSFALGKHFGFYQVSTGYLKIGCIGTHIDKWLASYEDIGKREGYSEKEITRYGDMIKLLKSWDEVES